mmetsp:Transcript_49649/g.116103  ORF Transcript_49649/g.116103 Transcript_49649/m.116103 type:complete len:520 (-) Transcript_49649:212-1771(-)
MSQLLAIGVFGTALASSLGIAFGASSCTGAEDDAALQLLQHRASSLSHSGRTSHGDSEALGLVSDWPHSKLRLCQQKSSDVYYGLKVTGLKQNNLGNRGPDTGAAEMRFAVEVTTPNKPPKSVDFVLVNTSFYLPFNIARNNLYTGDKEYFMINVWEGGNIEIEFKGTFVDSDTNIPVKMNNIYVTWYDIDQQNEERVERLYIRDFYKYSVSHTSVLHVDPEGDWMVVKPPPTQIGGVAWDPSNLSPAALDQSILLHYKQTSSFVFRTKVAGEPIASGRNYMFAIHSGLTECPNGFVCDIFGDPHISSFDNAKPVLLGENPHTFGMHTFDNMALAHDDFHDGDMWLVKSKHVFIQGRYGQAKGSTKSFLKAVAIGGPFLHNNTLVLATTARKCLWNQDEILQTLGDSHLVHLEDGGVVRAVYRKNVRHVHDANETTTGVEVALPMGIKLFLNRFETWLGLRIHLHEPIEGGQDGECGNINGNPDDDAQLVVQRRMDVRVHQNETLFVGRYANKQSQQQV